MSAISIGDLAQTIMMRQQNAALKSEMTRLAGELSSGQSSDVVKKLGGDVGYLADVENRLIQNEALQYSASEALMFANQMQISLERVQGGISALSESLLALGQSGLDSAQRSVSESAFGQMQAIVSAMNSDVAGRALFAGDATDTKPLINAEDMLADLRLSLAGATDISDVKTRLNAWFDDPGGSFEALGYTGGTGDLTPFQLGDGERVDLKIKADDPAVRSALKAAAMAALAKDESLGFSSDVQRGMLETATDWSLGANDEITGLRASLGFAEARLGDAQTRLSAEESSLKMAQSDLRGADLYDVAVKLEETQFRLESLYTATARLSQLSLMRFLQ